MIDSDRPRPGAIDVLNEQQLDVMGQQVKDLLQATFPEGMTPQQQGEVIADRFIGSVIGHGDFETSATDERVQPLQALQMVTAHGHLVETGEQTWETATKVFPRSDGLRAAVLLLAEDPRTRAVLPDLANRVVVTHGEVSLTSNQQLEGYLRALYQSSDGRPTSWQQLILKEVEDYAANPQFLDGPWSVASGAWLGSGVSALKYEKLAWNNAIRMALEQGAYVDQFLIGRTAEVLRRNSQNRPARR